MPFYKKKAKNEDEIVKKPAKTTQKHPKMYHPMGVPRDTRKPYGALGRP